MNTLNPFNGCLKFNCIYCGQHMECEPRLAGRQFLCPNCQHRIVIPARRRDLVGQALPIIPDTWDTDVPRPLLEMSARFLAANVLARVA